MFDNDMIHLISLLFILLLFLFGKRVVITFSSYVDDKGTCQVFITITLNGIIGR
jgi:hypothetical protein